MVRNIVLLLIAALLSFTTYHSRRYAQKERKETSTPQVSFLPDVETLKVASLGYDTFLADLIWIRALQYQEFEYGEQLAPQFADALIGVDPDFEPIYRWAAVTLVFGKGVTKKGVIKANKYLELGMKRFPKAAYYPYSIGINWGLYYPVKSKEEKKEIQKKAIHYLQLAMQRTDAPRNIPLLISGMMTDQGDEAKLAFIQEAYLTESDPEVRKVLEIRLRQLGGTKLKQTLEQLQREQNRWHQQQYPYLSKGLAIQMGERLTFAPD